MWDNIFGAWLYSFENESWIVVSQEKILCWIFSDLSLPSTWFKSKTAHFYLQPLFNMLWTCWVHCDKHIQPVALSGWHWDVEPWRCKNTPHTHTFPSTKLLTRVTVADKQVLVNPFWWNNHLFIHVIVQRAVLSLFQVARVIDCKHRSRWRHQQILHSAVPYGRGIWEKESIIGVQWFQKNPKPWVHRSVGNSASLVSHWNGGPSGWDFSVPTEHQWWILFISHTRTSPRER